MSSSNFEITYIGVNLFNFLGLPKPPNVEDFKRLWKNRSLDNDYHPITLLSSLLHTPDDALRLHERLKFSAFERDLMYFISQKKMETENVDEIM